jgi:cell division protein FtsQ
LRSKGKKKKASAYRNGERMVIFLKRGIIFFSALGIILLGVFIFKVSANFMIVREIKVTGNHYLDREEILRSAGLHNGMNLLRLHLDEIDRRLTQNPWIREVSLKKQFPYTLMIRLKEATPEALLSLHGRLFLIDNRGNVLQEIRDKVNRFLPVINIDPEKNRKGFKESLRLIDVLDKNGILAVSNSVEIGLEPYGLFLKLDGEAIKIGYGRYKKKIQRWVELEPELRRMGMKIQYVDLRFKDVVVKPLNIAKK